MSNEKQEATGSEIIQIGRDLHITIHHVPASTEKSAQPLLTKEQRKRISTLVAEVENAENGMVSQRRIRYALNRELDIGSIEEMTNEMYGKAITYLSGWRLCSVGESQAKPAMVAQVIRIWTIASSSQTIIIKFARDNFGTSMLNDLNLWQLRCTLAYAMSLWAKHWEEQKE